MVKCYVLACKIIGGKSVSLLGYSALQCPPEEYMRLSVQHGSITWISILPSGNVTLRLFGSSGHLPRELLTYKRVVCTQA